MTLAIGLHNIPEGLAVATVLVARGVVPRQAMIWCAAIQSLALTSVPALARMVLLPCCPAAGVAFDRCHQ